MKMLTVLLTAVLLSACVDYTTGPGEQTGDEPSIEAPPGWMTVWNDEFDAATIDPNNWEFEVNGAGGGNNELQYYTDRPENARIKDGVLIIEAHKETYTGPDGTRDYTSARLRTAHRGDWCYGRIEVRAKLPSGRGTWPAIWMLPTDWVYGGWPQSGEIDIMEHVGHDPDKIYGSVHTEAYNHRIGTQKTGTTMVATARTDFHVYAIEWSPEEIRWYVDDRQYFSFANERLSNAGADYRQWPFDKDFHLLLNLAVGGDWGGAQGVDPDIWPQQLQVDYVRVYKPEQ